MSFKQVSSLVAAVGATFALSAVAYADPGKSPNGAPGPAGNPNQPAASQPQANQPAGPQGNPQPASQGNSEASHGKSGQSHGKSQAKHPASRPTTKHGNHANPTPGTPRKGGSGKGGQNNFGKGKITICHATKSVKNPYVEITISVNGLHGHGPASDPRHHEGSWQDIIPAPAGGCPGTVPQQQQQQNGDQDKKSTEQTTTTTTTTEQQAAVLGEQVAGTPEVATPATGGSGVLGARASGGSAPKSAVLGASASGRRAPAAAAATRAAHGRLPFTGSNLVFVLIAAAVALLGGFALRRAMASQA